MKCSEREREKERERERERRQESRCGSAYVSLDNIKPFKYTVANVMLVRAVWSGSNTTLPPQYWYDVLCVMCHVSHVRTLEQVRSACGKAPGASIPCREGLRTGAT